MHQKLSDNFCVYSGSPCRDGLNWIDLTWTPLSLSGCTGHKEGGGFEAHCAPPSAMPSEDRESRALMEQGMRRRQWMTTVGSYAVLLFPLGS